jgi:hypothetical protein
MTYKAPNNNHFSAAYEKGHFSGLVDEGEYLRQSSLYKQILPRTPSRPKTSTPSVTKNLFNQRDPRLNFSSCFCAFLRLKNQFNLRLINDLRSTKDYVRKNKLFIQNEPKFRKVKFNITKVLTTDYDQLDTWSIRKNEPKTNPNDPNRTQF